MEKRIEHIKDVGGQNYLAIKIEKSDIDKFCENAVRERYDFECVAEVSTAFCMRIYSKKEELNE